MIVKHCLLDRIRSEIVLHDYRQKRSWLVRSDMPQIAGRFEPQDSIVAALSRIRNHLNDPGIVK